MAIHERVVCSAVPEFCNPDYTGPTPHLSLSPRELAALQFTMQHVLGMKAMIVSDPTAVSGLEGSWQMVAVSSIVLGIDHGTGRDREQYGVHLFLFVSRL